MPDKCFCGNNSHDGACYEVNTLSAPDAANWERLMAMTIDQRAALLSIGDIVNQPEIENFDLGVPLEAAHQVQRWGAEHDDGKKPEDWFWLVGYLAGKALHYAKALQNGEVAYREKAMHHCISTGAALRNWHTHIRTGKSVMRPGIARPDV